MKVPTVSDQYCWKKQSERDYLDWFLYAYAEATGQSLAVVNAGEAPDFVCEREGGQRVGVELTKIIASPETRRWHRLFGSGAMKLSADVGSEIFEAAARKAKILPNGRWKTFETFLVIQLFDNPLSEIHRGLEQIDTGDSDSPKFGSRTTRHLKPMAALSFSASILNALHGITRFAPGAN